MIIHEKLVQNDHQKKSPEQVSSARTANDVIIVRPKKLAGNGLGSTISPLRIIISRSREEMLGKTLAAKIVRASPVTSSTMLGREPLAKDNDHVIDALAPAGVWIPSLPTVNLAK